MFPDAWLNSQKVFGYKPLYRYLKRLQLNTFSYFPRFYASSLKRSSSGELPIRMLAYEYVEGKQLKKSDFEVTELAKRLISIRVDLIKRLKKILYQFH
jgi:hypothetical protein